MVDPVSIDSRQKREPAEFNAKGAPRAILGVLEVLILTLAAG